MTREEKNCQIAKSLHQTHLKRQNQTCRVFTCKIQENQLSEKQKEQLKMIFVEAKWLKNNIIAWSKDNPDKRIQDYDTKCRTLTHKDKDMNDVTVQLKYIPAQVKQCVQTEIIANIRTLASLKKKHKKVGQLNFVKEVNSVNLKQYGSSHRIISSKRIRIAGVQKTVVVNGLNQFINIPSIEIANAKLLNTPKGHYVQFVTYSDETQTIENNHKVIGIDFGCTNTITTSEGEKIKASVQESEYLKNLSKRNNRRLVRAFVAKYGHKPNFKNKTDAHNFKTIKRSENWKKDHWKIRKQYQKISNQKNDVANKIVASFKEYDKVIIQDEKLQSWHTVYGKTVQHSVLGRVKSKLMTKPNVVVLSSVLPTTKLCTKCGRIHDEITIKNRTFKCECGISENRDIHAANNMIWFYENNVGVGRTKLKRVETKALVDSIIAVKQTVNL